LPEADRELQLRLCLAGDRVALERAGAREGGFIGTPIPASVALGEILTAHHHPGGGGRSQWRRQYERQFDRLAMLQLKAALDSLRRILFPLAALFHQASAVQLAPVRGNQVSYASDFEAFSGRLTNPPPSSLNARPSQTALFSLAPFTV
jgi:hypothetical protein